MKRRTLIGATGALLLVACATPRATHPPAADHWSGRLSLQIQSDPVQAYFASFELNGTAERGELVLYSPIGTTLAQLTWTPESAQLQQGDQYWRDTHLNALTQRLTRTPIPVQALFDWLAGRATAADGWLVDHSSWAEGRLHAQRITPPPAAQLRIVLDR